jgi:dihydrofolate reductase
MKQNSEKEDHGFFEFQRSVDVIVMGSGSFKTVCGFDQWPYEKPVTVMSRSMSQAEIPENLAGKVEISDLAPSALMTQLETKGYMRAYIDGGSVVQSFLQSKLIADMKVTIVPILIGDGIRLFGEVFNDIDLRLDGLKQFPSGLVDLQYSVL